MAKMLTDRGIEYDISPLGDNSVSENPFVPVELPCDERYLSGV